MEDLLDEMRKCKSVKACIELALTDAYGVLGEDAALEGFDLENELTVVAVCRKGKQRARVALDSVEFPGITPIEGRWLKAWQQFSRGLA